MSSYHYSFYSPHRLHCLLSVFSHRFHCLLRIFSHRLHRFTQNFLLNIFSHRFHRFTQKLGCLQGGALVSARLCRLPEQEVHQPSKIDILPRNPQNPQNFLLRMFSHRFHRFTQNCLLSVFSHRFHRFTQNFLLRMFSHRFHRFTQIVWVPSRGCTCLKCTNQAI